MGSLVDSIDVIGFYNKTWTVEDVHSRENRFLIYERACNEKQRKLMEEADKLMEVVKTGDQDIRSNNADIINDETRLKAAGTARLGLLVAKTMDVLFDKVENLVVTATPHATLVFFTGRLTIDNVVREVEIKMNISTYEDVLLQEIYDKIADVTIRLGYGGEAIPIKVPYIDNIMYIPTTEGFRNISKIEEKFKKTVRK